MATRTFHFETISEAARFCDAEGIPICLIKVLKRNANGIATRCEISVPVDVWAA